MAENWRSYDTVAETYDRVRAPAHAAPARDLVAAVAPPVGGRVLDVGAGPGVASIAAMDAVGPTGLVVAVDRSIEMLRLARGKGVHRAAAAEALDLPFPDATFDAVVASFVIFFFTDYRTALFDMIRVLRPGSRLGATTWGPGEDEFSRAWRDVAETFVERGLLDDALRQAAPWEARFSDPRNLEETLRDAGLRPVEVRTATYRTTLSLEDYLAGRETSARGRFMRGMLSEPRWSEFRRTVAEEFRRRFADPIGDTSDVLIAVGTKPS